MVFFCRSGCPAVFYEGSPNHSLLIILSNRQGILHVDFFLLSDVFSVFHPVSGISGHTFSKKAELEQPPAF